MTGAAQDPRTIVEQFLAAYNASDLDTVAALFAASVHVVHYGTDFDVHGRDAVMERFHQSATGPFADRRFTPPTRVLADGDDVVIEHAWVATAAADVPGRAVAGQELRTELCTIFTVRGGVIIEYAEYG
jgi:uncharacterized protein (TIGR02246 family)